jgi:hypothetical protein
MLNFEPGEIESLLDVHDEAKVRQAALETDYVATDLRTAALRVARVLLYRSVVPWERDVQFPNLTDTAYERWVQDVRKSSPYLATVVVNWLSVPAAFHTMYPAFLFNRNFGQSRQIYERLLTVETSPPPYLSLIFLNLFRQALGLSHTEINRSHGEERHMAALFHDLLSGDLVEQWLARKKQNIRYYGGETHTILGCYDGLFSDPSAGVDQFNCEAEARYDLGGGFNTSEVERLLDCSFVSADRITPRCEDYDGDLVIQVLMPNGRRVVADDVTRHAFMERQCNVTHLPFDVLEDSFPLDFRSYAIVSTGFITSTVRPLARSKRFRKSGLHNLWLSLHGIARVLELVARSKEVDLFTVQRATNRIHKYKTCMLQWRKGRLLRLMTTNDASRKRFSKENLARIYEDINPTNPRYAALLAAARNQFSSAVDAHERADLPTAE